MPGSGQTFFSFEVFSLCLEIQASLLYLRFRHALSMFRHLTSVLVRHNVGENFGLGFVLICEGVLMCSLSLCFLRRSGGRGVCKRDRYFAGCAACRLRGSTAEPSKCVLVLPGREAFLATIKGLQKLRFVTLN
jgi:hypothetical protein